MHLTQEEQDMLNGARGETVRKCMKVLVTLGEIYGADHMIEVKNVHTPGVSYRVAGDAGLGYVRDASQDAKFCVPTTLNTIGIDEQDWKKIGFPEEFSHKQLELSKAYRDLGAISTCSCTPISSESPSSGPRSTACAKRRPVGGRRSPHRGISQGR